jgi:hypothetical protein
MFPKRPTFLKKWARNPHKIAQNARTWPKMPEHGLKCPPSPLLGVQTRLVPKLFICKFGTFHILMTPNGPETIAEAFLWASSAHMISPKSVRPTPTFLADPGGRGCGWHRPPPTCTVPCKSLERWHCWGSGSISRVIPLPLPHWFLPRWSGPVQAKQVHGFRCSHGNGLKHFFAIFFGVQRHCCVLELHWTECGSALGPVYFYVVCWLFHITISVGCGIWPIST